MVEHPAVNRRVAGSSPARGAYINNLREILRFFSFKMLTTLQQNGMYAVYVLYSKGYNKIYIGQTEIDAL